MDDISKKEIEIDKLKSIKEILLTFPINQWDKIENALKLLSDLPEIEQEKIFDFIKDYHKSTRKEKVFDIN